MTLRARLTLWYAAVLALVLLFYGATVYLVLSYNLTRQVEDNLERAAETIRQTFRRDVRGITFPPMALDLNANVYAQVWDAENHLVARNVTLLDEAFDSEALESTRSTYSTVAIGGVPLRVLTYPLVTAPEGELVGHLQLAASLQTVQEARRLMLLLLVGGGLLAVAMAAAVGWTTAGGALRPLDQVTSTALQITRADDLSRRIPMSGPPTDEVGRLIEAFNETLERLEGLFITQRRFMADVSHELRTPLTAIRGNVDLIQRLGKADPESLEAITSEVERMTRLVRDVLLLAQAESGNLPLGREVVELDTLLLEVFKEARLLAQDRVDVRLGSEDQVRVMGDRDRLKQVALNLIANALEHTPQGGTVTLGLACVGDWARLTVTDTGPGIPQEELPHIFERFYRIDRSRRRAGASGAGLGLSIAYWIARSHNGRIEVASEPGQGSTFSLWLPRVTEPGAPLEATRMGLATPAGGDRSG
ncbi:MAG TPA: ATP-binding protein [Anaerolineales bacterium]|nr:ATP-binding protein [Anaerolineales bacterium]